MHPIKDALANQLASALAMDTHQHSYALVDGALQPQAWAHLSRRFHVASLLPNATDGGKSAVAELPFLVAIEPERATNTIIQTVELAFERYACTWLQSAMDSLTLARHLAYRLYGQVPDLEVMLRFADARVLPSLCAVMTAEQTKLFYEGITHWWYLNRDMELTMLVLPDNNQTSPLADSWKGPLVLSADQEQKLLALSEPDVIMCLIEQHDPEALGCIPRESRHRVVQEHLIAAHKWDITSPTEQALFCMIALDPASYDFSSDAWQQALQQVKSKRISLIQALEQMTS
jgi:hypothetical protein